MMSKFLYCILFLVLTVLHTCSHLYPLVEATAGIRTVKSKLTRKFSFHVGYEYDSSMLWQAICNSFVVIYGLWQCDKEVHQEKHRQRSMSGQNPKDSRAIPFIVSAAEAVKRNWLRSRSKTPSTWELFPLRVFLYFTVPWSLTFLMNAINRYTTVKLVLEHFCTSELEILMLYFRVQLLYLQNWLPSDLGSYLGQLHALLETRTDFISYERDILIIG